MKAIPLEPAAKRAYEIWCHFHKRTWVQNGRTIMAIPKPWEELQAYQQECWYAIVRETAAEFRD